MPFQPMNRVGLFACLATRISADVLPHPLRLAVDGVDAAGKTTLADELAQHLSAAGRVVIRASIDRFHNPRAVRYRQGRSSPAGYYQDSFDLAALRQNLLDPLGPASPPALPRRVRTAVFDHVTDAPVECPEVEVPPDAVLVFDGVFLHRPELRGLWDRSIFLKVSFDTVLARAVRRDAAYLGSEQAVLDGYAHRYIPAQMAYLQSCQPENHADFVIVNDDPHLPLLLENPRARR
jgi:uridine kinase